MNYGHFKNTNSGKLVQTVGGEKAFLPNPLPPVIELGKYIREISDTMSAIGELRGACRRLANPYILVRPMQRLEAQTSSAMEGTYSTNEELLLTETGALHKPTDGNIETRNYVLALDQAIKDTQTLPISGRLLRQAHHTLLKDVATYRGRNRLPGEFKREQNLIGGTNIKNARFIPPPPNETARAMADLERFLNRENKTNSLPLIDMALAHYQFETIHPFADGNGRVGRMLISLMAITEDLLDIPALVMSPEIELVKDDYIDLMYNVSAHGQWEEWIKFFLHQAQLSAQRATRTIDHILNLRSMYENRIKENSRSNNLMIILDKLFEVPIINVEDVTSACGVSDTAARKQLLKLQNLGIITELTVVYPKHWAAFELMEISNPEKNMQG